MTWSRLSSGVGQAGVGDADVAGDTGVLVEGGAGTGSPGVVIAIGTVSVHPCPASTTAAPATDKRADLRDSTRTLC